MLLAPASPYLSDFSKTTFLVRLLPLRLAAKIKLCLINGNRMFYARFHQLRIEYTIHLHN